MRVSTCTNDETLLGSACKHSHGFEVFPVHASTITLSVTTTTGSVAWRSARDRIAAALARGERDVSLELVGDALDTSAISSLIAILRDVRERGGTLSVRSSDPTILATLATTGLDRVFGDASPAVPSGVPRRTARAATRLRPSILVAALVVLFALVALLERGAFADDDVAAPSELLRNVMSRDVDMRSYQAHVSVDVRLRSFPYASQHLDGTTYFKRPVTEVVFDSVPAYAKGFDKLYSDIDDPSSWERRFDLRAAGEKIVDGHRDVVVRMVAKVRGMIDHEDVAIDPATWRIDAMEWHYYNGGVVSMTQQYRSVGAFAVLASQHATIRIPYVHAAADATYSNYRTNVAIDDRIFVRQPR